MIMQKDKGKEDISCISVRGVQQFNSIFLTLALAGASCQPTFYILDISLASFLDFYEKSMIMIAFL